MMRERLPLRNGPRTGVSSTVWCVLFLAALLLLSALLTLQMDQPAPDGPSARGISLGIPVVPILIFIGLYRWWSSRRKP